MELVLQPLPNHVLTPLVIVRSLSYVRAASGGDAVARRPASVGWTRFDRETRELALAGAGMLVRRRSTRFRTPGGTPFTHAGQHHAVIHVGT